MAGKIGVSAMVAEMREKNGQQFMLKYAKSNKKKRVSVLEILPRCLYGRPSESEATKPKSVRQVEAPSDFKKKYVDKGLLPITDLNTGQFKTLKISHITRYNFMRVTH